MCNALSRYISRVLLPITNFIGRLWTRALRFAPTALRRFITQEEDRPQTRDHVVIYDGFESVQVTQEEFLFFPQHFPSKPLLARARFSHTDDANFYHGGTIAWTGVKRPNNDRYIVLALDDDHPDATDGTFEGEKLIPDVSQFSSRRFLMLPFSCVESLPVLRLGDFVVVRKKANSVARSGGFVRSLDGLVKLQMMNTDFKSQNIREEVFPDYQLMKTPPPEGEPVSQEVMAITGNELKAFLGMNKGIQGRRNSCYLDTILFAFFAFSNDFNHLLFDSPDNTEYDVLEVLNIIRYQIVFPLRSHQFVSFHHVEELRKVMAKRTRNDDFLTETRDIPECMEALFGLMLHIQPMLSIGHFVNGKVHFNDTFAVEVFNADNILYPTSKQLLERSAVSMQFCLQKMTDCLLMQLARETGQRMGVFPSLRLDLKPLIYNTVKVCSKCKAKASLQFWEAATDISNTFFCRECALRQGFDLKTGVVLPKADFSSVIDEETQLSLVAVICIERSHYNCFVRCSEVDTWVFFDSMHDQDKSMNPETEQMETFNIPVVKEVPDFRYWMEEAPKSFRKTRSLDSFMKSLTNSRDYLLAERLFQFPSLLIYKKN